MRDMTQFLNTWGALQKSELAGLIVQFKKKKKKKKTAIKPIPFIQELTDLAGQFR